MNALVEIYKKHIQHNNIIIILILDNLILILMEPKAEMPIYYSMKGNPHSHNNNNRQIVFIIIIMWLRLYLKNKFKKIM